MASDELGENQKRYNITKDILQSPINLTKHEDEKAGRILAPMAFLTAAATTLFAAFLNNNITWYIQATHVDLIVILFQFFIVFIVTGTILMLEAFGPYFEIPKSWRSRNKPEPRKKSEPKSFFFFDKIADMDVKDWTRYFENTNINEILLKASCDQIYEAHLISVKIKKKVKFIRAGKVFYYLAMVIFVVLTILGTIAYAIK